jgi:hypothetical protein
VFFVLFCVSYVHLFCFLAFVLTFSWQLCCWTGMLNKHLLNYELHVSFVLSKENYQILCIFINVNILGSQCVHSTNDLILLCRPEDDQLMDRNM